MSGPRVTLQRQGYTEFGTLGRWTVYDADDVVAYSCLAAENPDRGNLPEVSCIPEGEYKLVRARYNRGDYPAFQIFMANGSEIPGRKHVLVHGGNYMHDVHGCVVLGNKPIASPAGDAWGVGPSMTSSGGFTRFMRVMDRLGVDELPLSIFFRKG